MNRAIGVFITVVCFSIGFCISFFGLLMVTGMPVDEGAKPANTEQMVILHYIKNNTGHIGNEVNAEYYDGNLTQQDYNEVLERVQAQINRDGLSKFYGPVQPH